MARVSSLDLTVNDRSAETCGNMGKSPGGIVLIEADARSVSILKSSPTTPRHVLTPGVGQKSHSTLPALQQRHHSAPLPAALSQHHTQDWLHAEVSAHIGSDQNTPNTGRFALRSTNRAAVVTALRSCSVVHSNFIFYLLKTYYYYYGWIGGKVVLLLFGKAFL